MSQLFVVAFTVVGKAANYTRTVIVSATDTKEAEAIVVEHFKTVENVQVVEVLPKFANKIHGFPIFTEEV